MAISSDLPPLVLELRAKAGELYSTLGKVKAETKSMADSTAASTASMAAKTDEASTSMSSRLSTLGAHAQKALLPLGLGAVAVGYESLKSAVDFQKSTTLLVTAGGEARSQLATVQNGIKQIAMQTGTSTSQLSEGMYTVEKAAYRGSAGLNVLKAAAEGASAEGVNLGIATNALTDVMQDYHMKASGAVQAENMIVKASGEAKTTMQDFAGSLASVLPLASSLHISFAQVGGAIAAMTQHGMSAQQASQNLANTISNLSGQNNVAVAAMNQLGLNVQNVSKDLGQRGLSGTLDIVMSKIAQSSKGGMVVVNAFKQSATATNDLKTELSKMSPPLAKLSQQFESGKVSYKDYYTQTKKLSGSQYELAKSFLSTYSKASGFNAILTSGNAAQRTTAKELETLFGGMTGMRTALMLTGGNAKTFSDDISGIGAAGKETGKDIATWAQTQSTLSVQLAKAKQHIAVLGLNIGAALIPIVEKMLSVTVKVFSWLGSHKAVLITLGVLFGTLLVGALAAATAAWVAASVAFMTSPLGLIIMGVIALIAAIVMLVMHWTQVWNFIKSSAKAVGEFLKGVWDDFLKVANDVWNAILKFFKDIWNDITRAFTTAVDRVKQFLTGAWNFIKSTASAAWNLIKGVIMAPVHLIQQGFDWFVQNLEGGLSNAWSRITGAAQGAWHLFHDYVINPVEQVWSDIQSIIGGFVGFFQGVWDSISSGAASVWNGIVSTIESAIGGVGSVISGVVNAMIDAINWVIGAINQGTGDLSDVWTWTGLPPIPAIPTIPQVSLATGGIVHATPGGIIARIAEAGVDEAVVPLDGKHGLGGGVVNNYYVNVSPQGSIISDQDLAQVVRTQLLRLGARHGGVDTYQPYRR